jgi:manganese transport protein
MLALLASGFSSSVLGVMAGQAIMQGFVSFRIPLWLRRLVVIMPSFAVISAGIEVTHALVLSQVGFEPRPANPDGGSCRAHR